MKKLELLYSGVDDLNKNYDGTEKSHLINLDKNKYHNLDFKYVLLKIICIIEQNIDLDKILQRDLKIISKKNFQYLVLLKKLALEKNLLKKIPEQEKCRICLKQIAVGNLKDHGDLCIKNAKKISKLNKITIDLMNKIESIEDQRKLILFEL